MSRARTNPRRKPATQADVERAKREAKTEATEAAIAIFFTVMLDKHQYTAEMLQSLWSEVNKLSEEITEGRVKISDSGIWRSPTRSIWKSLTRLAPICEGSQNGMGKLQTIDGKMTTWCGLWWHPECNAFHSPALNLSELRKFKGLVRLYVKKNRYYNNGENGRPNYCFCLRDANASVFQTLEVQDDEDEQEEEEERLYTRDEVIAVMHGACRDGQNGYEPGDLLIEDYV